MEQCLSFLYFTAKNNRPAISVISVLTAIFSGIPEKTEKTETPLYP
jgi:hypothetical protein